MGGIIDIEGRVFGIFGGHLGFQGAGAKGLGCAALGRFRVWGGYFFSYPERPVYPLIMEDTFKYRGPEYDLRYIQGVLGSLGTSDWISGPEHILKIAADEVLLAT